MSEEDLDLERGDQPGDAPEPAPEKPARTGSRRQRGRPSTANVSNELKSSISGGLKELAEWLEGRDEELAETLHESAPRIAEFLAVHAAKRAGVAKAVRYVFAKGGPFAALRAFGPIVRAIGDRMGARRAETEPEDSLLEQEPEQEAGEDAAGVRIADA